MTSFTVNIMPNTIDRYFSFLEPIEPFPSSLNSQITTAALSTANCVSRAEARTAELPIEAAAKNEAAQNKSEAIKLAIATASVA